MISKATFTYFNHKSVFKFIQLSCITYLTGILLRPEGDLCDRTRVRLDGVHWGPEGPQVVDEDLPSHGAEGNLLLGQEGNRRQWRGTPMTHQKPEDMVKLQTVLPFAALILI